MRVIAKCISRIVFEGEAALSEVKAEVAKLCEANPLYPQE